MVPKPPDQKRKRGRQPGASKSTEDASDRERPEDNDDDAGEESRPQKRGRKAVKDKASANPDIKEHDEPAQPGKRGRPVKSKRQIPEAEVESSPRRSGRERRLHGLADTYSAGRGNHSPTQFSSPPSDSSRMPPPPRRTKKPEPDPRSSTPRRSGRDRRAWDAEKLFSASRQSVEQQEESSSVARKVMDAGKVKKTVNEAQQKAGPKAQKQKATAQDTSAERKHPNRISRDDSPGVGPSWSRNEKRTKSTEAEASTTIAAQPKRRGRPKGSDPKPQESKLSHLPRSPRRSSQAREEQEQTPAKSKRKQSQPRRSEPEVDAEDNSESDEEGGTLPFRHLRETTRNIQRSTISDKWTPLDPPSIDAVSNFLADAQRPVLLRLQNTRQRRGHASSALGLVIRRLRSRLVKGVPFPAPTAGAASRSNAASYEDDFDFERVVDAMQNLENTLNPLLHSVGLLEKEIGKAEDALARDYDSLHRLETNAKAEAKEWRDKTKREHVLAPGLKRKGEQETESPDRLELVPADKGGISGGLFKGLEDEELVTLSKQIGSHMESMRANLQPIDGVLPAITKSKAALQQVLLKHLDEEQYESVLLG